MRGAPLLGFVVFQFDDSAGAVSCRTAEIGLARKNNPAESVRLAPARAAKSLQEFCANVAQNVAVAQRAQCAPASRYPVDLAPIVRRLVDGLQTLARDRGVNVATDAANADVTESSAQGGTGLGLAPANHILNRHRGRSTARPGPAPPSPSICRRRPLRPRDIMLVTSKAYIVI